ncbi:cGMP-specific 3',5'-cyclic phosphodiesterase [Halotydeus destructor]|nr:cGMP-specific 3',5'-cyclic phosphodiesterase [Halotydeus destructor]
MILNSEGNNILQSLSPDEYTSAIKIVKSAILSTDLAQYFTKRDKFVAIADAGETTWRESEKRDLLRGMLMTACDVSAIAKPWPVQKKIAELVAAEFFQQGDIEKSQLHQQPMPMMDRDKINDLPKMQVGFIDDICLPVYSILSKCWPGLVPLKDGCSENRRQWLQLAELQSER